MPIFREDLKLHADKSFEDLSTHLYSILGIIAEEYLEEKAEEIFDFIRTDPESTIDDEFGPVSTTDAIYLTFRAALIHVDLAKKVKEEGKVEVAWARLAWASQLIGRVQHAESIELQAKKQAELTYDLKVKAIELVSCLRPEGGWVTHEAAYRGIAPELLVFRDGLIDDKKRRKEKAKPVDLIQQIESWRKGDPLVRAAFAGNSAKVKAERAKVVGK